MSGWNVWIHLYIGHLYIIKYEKQVPIVIPQESFYNPVCARQFE